MSTIQSESGNECECECEGEVVIEETKRPSVDDTTTMESAGIRKLQVGGDSMKLEEWGPIIINTDGTTRRIANWGSMTQRERESAWRLIGARNERRRADLIEKAALKAQSSSLILSDIQEGSEEEEEEVPATLPLKQLRY